MGAKKVAAKAPKTATVAVSLYAEDNASLRGEAPWVIADNASMSECQTFVRRLSEMVRIADALGHSVLVTRSADGNALETTFLPDAITVTTEAPHA